MRFTELHSLRRPAGAALMVGLSLTLGSCAWLNLEKKPEAPSAEKSPTAPSGVEQPAPSKGPRFVKLPPPRTPRNWSDARQQAAERLVAASPDSSYTGKPPFMLLAIPVMSIELNADGSVRNVSVMRHPSQAKDTVQLAIQAIHRAAPYGDVSKLPKPWKFNETFLFKEDRKFKPMTLDRGGS